MRILDTYISMILFTQTRTNDSDKRDFYKTFQELVVFALRRIGSDRPTEPNLRANRNEKQQQHGLFVSAFISSCLTLSQRIRPLQVGRSQKPESDLDILCKNVLKSSGQKEFATTPKVLEDIQEATRMFKTALLQ